MPRRPALVRALLAVLAVAALALGTQTMVQSATAVPPPFDVRPGATQLEVLNATSIEGQSLTLLRDGINVAGGTVDSQGSLVWRQLQPGSYTVRSTSPAYQSPAAQVTAFDAAPPAQAFYDGQTLTPGWSGDGGGAASGFNFIETRDGTTLSANVALPGPAADGPYPTVVEYCGYDPSNPGNTTFAQLFNALGLRLRRREHPRHRLLRRLASCPSSRCRASTATTPSRPSPRSRGRSSTRSAWSASPTPASRSCTSRAPSRRSLSAITPLSVIDDTYRGTLYPGGILNTGFAVPWADAARARRRSRTARAGSRTAPTTATPCAPTTSCSGCRTPTRSR